MEDERLIDIIMDRWEDDGGRSDSEIDDLNRDAHKPEETYCSKCRMRIQP